MLENGEDDEEDGVVRTRANTLLAEEEQETSIFSDTQTNVLETEDTNEMIITVGNLSGTTEENGGLQFPLHATPEMDMENAPGGTPASPPNKTDNSESVSPSA